MKNITIATLTFATLGWANSLPNLLDLASRSAEREMTALSSVACTETVVETKVNQKKKTEERRRQIFDYLVLADTDDGDLAITESRIAQGKAKTESKPLLLSTGFATMMLILHPAYQNSFEFTDLGVVDEGGKMWRRLGFEFRPGKRSPSLLRSGTREFPLAWKGEARIDDSTGQVAAIHASLGSQLEEIGLVKLETTVQYRPQPGHISGDWLPTEAVIDLETNHQHWHNVHTFTSYKRFDVATSEKREAVKQ